MLLNIIVASFGVSLISLAGVITLSLDPKLVKKSTLYLISLAAGSLMGGAFLHLLPESAENLESESLFASVLISFVFFLAVEKILHWRHCHDHEYQVHTFGYMSLIGDGVHNFIDGMVIAVTFMISWELGVASTVAIALHEIPQEIGDFGVLLHAGFKKKTAILLNFASALIAVLGAVVGYLLSSYGESLVVYLLPIAAGGFIYIAASDLLPEIRKEAKSTQTIITFVTFLVGVGIMYLFKMADLG